MLQAPDAKDMPALLRQASETEHMSQQKPSKRSKRQPHTLASPQVSCSNMLHALQVLPLHSGRHQRTTECLAHCSAGPRLQSQCKELRATYR